VYFIWITFLLIRKYFLLLMCFAMMSKIPPEMFTSWAKHTHSLDREQAAKMKKKELKSKQCLQQRWNILFCGCVIYWFSYTKTHILCREIPCWWWLLAEHGIGWLSIKEMTTWENILDEHLYKWKVCVLLLRIMTKLFPPVITIHATSSLRSYLINSFRTLNEMS
jgi:hypothetical protein